MADSSKRSDGRGLTVPLVLVAVCLLGVGLGLVAAKVGDRGQSVVVAGPSESPISTTTLEKVTTTSTVTTTSVAPTTTAAPTTVVPTTRVPRTTVAPRATVPAPPPTVVRRISGAMYLFDAKASVTGTWKAGAGCFGQGGYSDMRAGAGVTVKDASGSLIGTTTLGAGIAQPWPEVAPDALQCVFPYSVSVPDTGFYTFEVSHRGTISKSRADLAATGWTMSFYLGS
jgi:hypothetical protein